MLGEQLVHAPTLEALFLRALENRLTPACLGHLREAGLDLERKLASTYPLEQWKQLLRIAADHVYAGVPTEAAYYSLGERFMDGYFSTLFGRALLGVVRLAGPRRTLLHIGLGLRTSTSFHEVRVVERGSSSFDLWLNDVLADQPTFAAGLLSRLVEVAGGQRVTVLPEGFDGLASTFRIDWSEQTDAAALPLSESPTVGERGAGPRAPV